MQNAFYRKVAEVIGIEVRVSKGESACLFHLRQKTNTRIWTWARTHQAEAAAESSVSQNIRRIDAGVSENNKHGRV